MRLQREDFQNFWKTVETYTGLYHSANGIRTDEIAIVGDRLYTDIAVADQSDVTSILVLSGESTREDVKTSDVKPDVILEDLSEITKML